MVSGGSELDTYYAVAECDNPLNACVQVFVGVFAIDTRKLGRVPLKQWYQLERLGPRRR